MSEYLIKIINRVIGIFKILCWKILYGSRFHFGKMTFFYPGCHLINAMDGNYNSFSKHLRQPCKERRSFSVDVHHIVFSKCTIKCRKCGGADCSKSP